MSWITNVIINGIDLDRGKLNEFFDDENLFLKPVPHWHASGDKEAYEIVFGAYNYFDTELFVEHFKECCKGKKWSLFLQFEGDGYRVVAEGVDVAI